MNGLILRLEELTMESKGISNLIGALFYTRESGTSLDEFSDGLNLLYGLSIDNSRKLEEVWQEMHLLNKNNKTRHGSSVTLVIFLLPLPYHKINAISRPFSEVLRYQ